MNVNVQKLIIRMSKLMAYAAVFCFSLTLGICDTGAQQKLLNEISVGKMANYISAADDEVQKTTSSIVKDSESGKKIMSDDPRISKMSKRAKGMAMAGNKIAKKLTPPSMP
mgnify:CR=1 FL=1